MDTKVIIKKTKNPVDVIDDMIPEAEEIMDDDLCEDVCSSEAERCKEIVSKSIDLATLKKDPKPITDCIKDLKEYADTLVQAEDPMDDVQEIAEEDNGIKEEDLQNMLR